MIYDVLLLLIFGGLIWYGIRRGAARSLVSLVLSLLSYLAATALGKIIATQIYNLILRPTIHNVVVTNVYNISNDTLDNALEFLDISKVLDALPNFGGLVDFSVLGDSINEKVKSSLQGNIKDISVAAAETTETYVEPIIINILAFFITIFLFFIIVFLMKRFLTRPLLSVFKLPVLKQMNMILGGVIGAVEAFLVASMLGYLLRLLVPYVSTKIVLLHESTINSSFIFSLFYSGNIFSLIASWINI